MDTENKSSKRSAILTSWDEARGFGFCSVRNPNNPTQRKSWFIHASRILRIDNPNGIVEIGSQVLFNEEPHPKGMMAVNVEVLSLGPRIQRNAGLKALTGKTGAGSGQ